MAVGTANGSLSHSQRISGRAVRTGGSPAYTQLHLVQRPPGNTSLAAPASGAAGGGGGGGGVCGSLTVDAYAAAVAEAHATTLSSPTCGCAPTDLLPIQRIFYPPAGAPAVPSSPQHLTVALVS